MSTFTPDLNLELPALGADVNSWNVPLNSNFTIIDQAIAGVTVVTLSNANVVLTNVQSAFKIIKFTGTLTANVAVTLTPPVTGEWVFSNQTTGAFTVTVKASAVDAGIVTPQGLSIDLNCGGNGGAGGFLVFGGVGSVAGRQGAVTLAVADVSGAAPLASPALTGTPTAPTQTPGDNTTKLATDAFVTAAIAAQVAQMPQLTVYTTGSGTYTTPAGATYLDVEMIGGGSGGGGAGTTTTGGAGGAGGATTFGTSLLTANGGPATPTSSVTTYPTPAVATGSADVVSGGLGGGSQSSDNLQTAMTASGGNGASSFYGSGGPGGTSSSGSSLVLPGTAVDPGSGGGGGALSANVSGFTGWGGNAGAFLRAIIATPAVTYAYAIGAGGTAGAAGTSGTAGSAGAVGYIRVVAYFQ